MDWLGIGVLLIGIALLILVIILIKPLGKLSGVLESLQKTTDDLPETITEVTDQATQLLQTGNETLSNVNDQVTEISPVFQIVGDIGHVAREFTSKAVDKTVALKQQTSAATEVSNRKKYEGLYGLLSFILFFTERKKDIKNALPK